MILRRIIAHFRKQEWTAIGLDFVIVVVGVFVGLQVNNWNDARNEKALEILYLQNFDRALTETADWLERRIALYDAGIENGRQSLDDLADSRLDPEEIERLRRVIERVQQVYALDPYGLEVLAQRSAENDITLDNHELSEAVSLFGANMRSTAKVLDHITQRLNSYLFILDQYGAVGPILPEERHNELFNSSEALADPSFRIALAGASNMTFYRRNRMDYMKTQALELQAQIRKELE